MLSAVGAPQTDTILGQLVSDLQDDDILITPSLEDPDIWDVTGTLNYVTGFTQYDSVDGPILEEQEGHYLALAFEVTPDGSTVAYSVKEYEDMVAGGALLKKVFRVYPEDDVTWIGVTVKNGTFFKQITLNLLGLTREEPPVVNFGFEAEAANQIETILGVLVSDMQADDITITQVEETDVFEVAGNLKYVTGFTDFSEEAEEQEGNYLAIDVDITPVDATVTGYKGVYRIADLTDDKTITISKSGQSRIITLDVSKLVLASGD